MNVSIKCSDCGNEKMISRETFERTFQGREENFICLNCGIDVMDGYLPLETKPNKYGLTGKQYDNSQGTF